MKCLQRHIKNKKQIGSILQASLPQQGIPRLPRMRIEQALRSREFWPISFYTRKTAPSISSKNTSLPNVTILGLQIVPLWKVRSSTRTEPANNQFLTHKLKVIPNSAMAEVYVSAQPNRANDIVGGEDAIYNEDPIGPPILGHGFCCSQGRRNDNEDRLNVTTRINGWVFKVSHKLYCHIEWIAYNDMNRWHRRLAYINYVQEVRPVTKLTKRWNSQETRNCLFRSFRWPCRRSSSRVLP